MQLRNGNLQHTLEWLLEPENPPVRYRALTELLGKSESDQEVQAARQANMENGPVARILAKQDPRGWWGKPEDYYERSKYKGTVWNMILLAEFGANPEDERIQKASDFILDWSQDASSGGFAYLPVLDGGGDHNKVIPCLTGNMLWSLLRFSRFDEPKVQHAIQWVTTYQRFDDKEGPAPTGWPYEIREKCWGRHTCHMGVVKALKALAEIPVEKRTSEVNQTIRAGAEYILRHHIYRKSHNLVKVGLPQWQQLGFPHFWGSDALEILDILTHLGYRDDRMQEALDLVKSKQDASGRWKMESSWNGRMLVRFEEEGKDSKWVTLKALKVLQYT
ncbi:MAG TPA: hypothetical protein VMS73_08195 [Anaerolineaceae bacterium]|nr:hypothetical protein [Anaerolineaceae bacterium]